MIFNRFQKDDLVAYIDHPKSIPLGIVKEIKEQKGKAVVLLYLLDTNIEEDVFSLKCVPYHKLELVSRPTYLKNEGKKNGNTKKKERREEGRRAGT
jgi:hypothetical protein